MNCQLVLIETSGNQKYIFQSNKLKEMVGASELTWRCGTLWVREAICAITGKDSGIENKENHRAWLKRSANNPPFSNGCAVEAIQLTSGKALLLVDTPDHAKEIIRAVTLRALKEAPGLDISGVFVPVHAGDLNNIEAAIKNVHETFQRARQARISTQARFPMQPVYARCNSTGLPAEGMYDDNLLSRNAISKRVAKETWPDRWKSIARDVHLYLPHHSYDFEQVAEGWVGLVHADGNGLGQIFIDFVRIYKATGKQDAAAFWKTLREFSIEIEEATEAAFVDAVAKLQLATRWFRESKEGANQSVQVKPVLPLVLGGDDLTALVDGEQVIDFTVNYLEAFQKFSAEKPTIKLMLEAADLPCYLTACAGISIVGNHFPLHLAYELSEQLCQSAKTVKAHSNAHSAFDVHPIYDSNVLSLDEIRAQLHLGQHKLYRRPFVLDAPPGAWIAERTWQATIKRIVTIKDENDGRRTLPSKLLHELRAALFDGKDQTDSLSKLMQSKHPRLQDLIDSDQSLFGADLATGFLDALELSPFYKPNSPDKKAEPTAPVKSSGDAS